MMVFGAMLRLSLPFASFAMSVVLESAMISTLVVMITLLGLILLLVQYFIVLMAAV